MPELAAVLPVHSSVGLMLGLLRVLSVKGRTGTIQGTSHTGCEHSAQHSLPKGNEVEGFLITSRLGFHWTLTHLFKQNSPHWVAHLSFSF